MNRNQTALHQIQMELCFAISRLGWQVSLSDQSPYIKLVASLVDLLSSRCQGIIVSSLGEQRCLERSGCRIEIQSSCSSDSSSSLVLTDWHYSYCTILLCTSTSPRSYYPALLTKYLVSDHTPPDEEGHAQFSPCRRCKQNTVATL
jgi:hypothetical protein